MRFAGARRPVDHQGVVGGLDIIQEGADGELNEVVFGSGDE